MCQVFISFHTPILPESGASVADFSAKGSAFFFYNSRVKRGCVLLQPLHWAFNAKMLVASKDILNNLATVSISQAATIAAFSNASDSCFA